MSRRWSGNQYVRAWPPSCPKCGQKQYGSDTENTLHTMYCKGLKPRIRVVIWFPERGGELKLTKNLKRIIATSFLQERISIKSLAELYGFSIAQIENVIREAIIDQRGRAEFAEKELRQTRDENTRLIHQAEGEPLQGL